MENKLDSKTFEQLANLAKLDLTYTDKQDLQQSLEQMLHYVDKLSELSTAGTLPLTHFTKVTCQPQKILPAISLRDDIPCCNPHPTQLVSLAPKQSDSYFVVPNSLNNENES